MKAKKARKISEQSNNELTEILFKIYDAAKKGETEIYEEISIKTENSLNRLGYTIQGRGISW